jgi:hypothetical protein
VRKERFLQAFSACFLGDASFRRAGVSRITRLRRGPYCIDAKAPISCYQKLF